MPSLGRSRTHWPVIAWMRLQVPVGEAPVPLMGGLPPPSEPPLDFLERNPVTTDPRKRIFHFEQERDDWVLRLVWDSDDPTILEAEFRAPHYGSRPTNEQVRKFWAAVKELVRPLGPLPVVGADPRPV